MQPSRTLLARPLCAALVFALLAASAALAQETESYLIGVGDVLSIAVLAGGEGEVTPTEAVVAGEGTFDVLHLGPIKVAGKSTSAIRDEIRTALVERGIYRAPQVAVNVKEYGSQGVNVAGYVETPSRHFLKGPTRLLDIISLAGGVKEEEAGDEILILREGFAEPIRVRRSVLFGMDLAAREKANLRLQAGDTVHVPRRVQFCILGPVLEPDCLEYADGMTVEDAISKAGGLDTTKADRHAITIRRPKGGTVVEFVVDLDDTGAAGARFPIAEGDTIVVAEAVLKVTVEGTVKEPGKKDWVPGMTITDAIAEAGGTQTEFYSGKLNKVILRRGGSPPRVINVKLIQRGKASDVVLEPGDKIFVDRGW